ncbi:MAG: hypothetical protein R3B45_02085 [Bdellovibrionota bacterium]
MKEYLDKLVGGNLLYNCMVQLRKLFKPVNFSLQKCTFHQKSYKFHCYLLLLFVGCLFCFVDSKAEEEADTEAISRFNATIDSPFDISDGSRVNMEEKGFSIIPPVGWEVHKSYPNTTLLMQIPFSKGLEYQRTIQIMRFNGAVPIDEITAEDFARIIERKYSHADGAISDYRMRDFIITKIADESQGILYYSEFMLQDSPLMQAHILLSSRTHRYLLTYTDLASHFEGELASEYLEKAWQSMVSIHLDSAAPIRHRVPALFGFTAGFLFLLVLLMLSYRRYKAGKKYELMLDEAYDISDEESDVREGLNVSEISGVSDVAMPLSVVGDKNRRQRGLKTATKELAYIDDEEDEWNLEQGDSEVIYEGEDEHHQELEEDEEIAG